MLHRLPGVHGGEADLRAAAHAVHPLLRHGHQLLPVVLQDALRRVHCALALQELCETKEGTENGGGVNDGQKETTRVGAGPGATVRYDNLNPNPELLEALRSPTLLICFAYHRVVGLF